MYDVEKLVKRIKFCENFLDNADGYDDMNVDTMEYKMFRLCVNFLDGLDRVYDNFTEQGKEILYKG